MITESQIGVGTLRGVNAGPVKQQMVESAENSFHSQSCAGNKEQSKALSVALLTGGWDKPYALGLAAALVSRGARVDFLGTSELDAPELHGSPQIRFVNLQEAPRQGGGLADKALRTSTYYWRTVVYAATAKPRVFHILWNTKFLLFDRTVLTLFYKLLGKRVVFTAHNVNAGKRDGNDTWLNRLTLKIQYRLVDHIFVHTEKMNAELVADFHVRKDRVSVIPFGINSTVPNTELTSAQARERLGLRRSQKVILFFGNILPYKGLEYLISAFTQLAYESADYRLIIAGKPKLTPNDCETYWNRIKNQIAESGIRARIIERYEYVPDEQTEVYFKAADVLILPYTHIFQSGVLFLSYNFGLPVVASDVGSLKHEIVAGTTGLTCKPRDSTDLAQVIRAYFSSHLFKELEKRRLQIREFATEKYSWIKAAEVTADSYEKLLARDKRTAPKRVSHRRSARPRDRS